jgi:hypothetical protein
VSLFLDFDQSEPNPDSALLMTLSACAEDTTNIAGGSDEGVNATLGEKIRFRFSDP